MNLMFVLMALGSWRGALAADSPDEGAVPEGSLRVVGRINFYMWPEGLDARVVVLAGDRVLELDEDNEFELVIDRPTGISALAVRKDGRVAVGTGETLAPKDGLVQRKVVFETPDVELPWFRPRQIWRQCLRTLAVLEAGAAGSSETTADIMAAAHRDYCRWFGELTKEQAQLLAGGHE